MWHSLQSVLQTATNLFCIHALLPYAHSIHTWILLVSFGSVPMFWLDSNHAVDTLSNLHAGAFGYYLLWCLEAQCTRPISPLHPPKKEAFKLRYHFVTF